MIHVVKIAGICYDNYTQSVYVGGGGKISERSKDYSALSRVQSYDLNVGKWKVLPLTVMEHRNYPIMWVDESNHNLLFIGSVFQNGLEYIDLRDDERRWKCVCVPNHTQGLSAMFGLEFSNSSYSRLCITKI